MDRELNEGLDEEEEDLDGEMPPIGGGVVSEETMELPPPITGGTLPKEREIEEETKIEEDMDDLDDDELLDDP